ncbi:MAG: hypothetical protein JO359_07595 [Candidatus Eremiobacteraeota bacterium]|nr:hypothetical protein [Candidatus Eremiobacteraeota bacterium]
MTADERRPERFVALIDAALAAYAARWPLYIALAAATLAADLAIDALARFDAVVLLLTPAFVDGFTSALVSIDVAGRVREEPLATGELFRAALLRWPVVAVVLVIVSLIEEPLQLAVFGNLDETGYGLLILPGLAVLGVLGLPSVIASLDEGVPPLARPGNAVLRSLFIAATWPNLGRLTLAGAMLAVVFMVQELAMRWLGAHGMATAQAWFWGNMPADALFLAPFQAFFTLLYLDFVVREKRR